MNMDAGEPNACILWLIFGANTVSQQNSRWALPLQPVICLNGGVRWLLLCFRFVILLGRL